eukprot:tig00020537_g10304.t1
MRLWLVAVVAALAIGAASAAPAPPAADPPIAVTGTCPHTHCYDLSCGVEIAAYAEGAHCADFQTSPCDDEDIGSVYTPCNTQTNSRSLVYYFKPPATCRGGKALPPPVTGIRCDLTCPAGQRLNGELKSCSDCQPGTFSTGGALRFTDWSSGFPPQFSTECRDAEGEVCNPWRVRNGSVIDSGDHSDQQNLVAVLALRVLLVRDGAISFEYRVDAEPGYDGLSLFVDDLQAMPLVSQQATYTTFTLPASRGYRVFKFIYSKDYSMSYGRDRAWIRNIAVDGVSLADPTCTACPAGRFAAAAKATDCDECPPNSYAPEPGAAACLPCPATQFSAAGSAKCTDRKACTINVDYVEVLSACAKQADGSFRRTRSYEFLQPVICRSDIFQLPPSTTEPCEPPPCARGQYRRDSDAQCVSCEDGTFTDGSTQARQCTACGAGHAAIKYETISDFGAWPGAFKGQDGQPNTGCDGECSTQGWQLAPGHMYSGIGHGQVADVYVEMAGELYADGALAFEYRVECPALPASVTFGAPRLIVAVDGHAAESYSCPASGRARIPVPAGTHTFRWIFHKRSYLASPQDVASVANIVLEGSLRGGGGECRACPAGTFAGAKSAACAPCPVGASSPQAATACSKCPANTFASVEGSSECRSCGKGTLSPAGAAGCSYTCELEEGAARYDVSRLASPRSMYIAQDEADSGNEFLVDVCVRAPASSGNRSCENPLEGTKPMLSCMRDAVGNIINTGDVFGIAPLPASALEFLPPAPSPSPGAPAPAPGGDPLTGGPRPLGVTLEYTYGEPLAAADVPAGATGADRARRTVLYLLCDVPAGQGAPRVVAHNASHTLVAWASAFACPLCTPDDVTVTTTACYNGKQTTRYFFADEGRRQRCFGGEELPAPVTSACTVPSKFPTGAFLGAAITALVVVPAAVVLFLKYRKYRALYAQYEALGHGGPERELADDSDFVA